jgi:hypothetical protein
MVASSLGAWAQAATNTAFTRQALRILKGGKPPPAKESLIAEYW